jgi:hypothetical protein
MGARATGPTGRSDAQYAETYEGRRINYRGKRVAADRGPDGEAKVRWNQDRHQRQNRRNDRRVRLGIDRLCIDDAVLLAQFRNLVVHARARWHCRSGLCRRRGSAADKRTRVGSHCKLQEQQCAQAKPCDVFSCVPTHKQMISESLLPDSQGAAQTWQAPDERRWSGITVRPDSGSLSIAGMSRG